MIKLQLIGNVGNDAIVNNVNGKTVINFSVAHSEKWRDAQGNEKEKTTWISCAYWIDRTNIANYIKKGTQIYVEGIPEASVYTNNQGQTTAQQRLNVRFIQLLGQRSQQTQNTQPTQPTQHRTLSDAANDFLNQPNDFENDDVPF